MSEKRLKRSLLALLATLTFATPLVSATLLQQGDHKGEKQKHLFPHIKNPPAPVFSPQEALKKFQLQPGYKIQLVASEPLINDPVTIAIDEDGRIWAAEMNGYMRDIRGTDELKPTGRIVVLEDTNEDGLMDKSTVFLDKIILPRTLMRYKKGIILGSPPYLTYYPDKNNDLKPEKETIIATDYGNLRDNPEHSANGAYLGQDNWIYNSKYSYRLKEIDGKWVKEYDAHRGQWGISEDDYGRKYFNNNSASLYADLVPFSYYARNISTKRFSGINNYIGRKVNAVWPSRITLGVNRGYQKGTLAPNGRLARFTGACAPLIYRGHQFPDDAYSNAFVCEPTAYLIKRYKLEGLDQTQVEPKFVYRNREFLTSTDERFRPVNLRNAPDGSLYVVDMYKGVFQHKQFLTTYLKTHLIKQRLTENNIGFGRIYRVFHEDKSFNTKQPKLSKASNLELAKLLNHPGAWWRHTAKRLLIERKASDVTQTIEDIVLTHKNHVNRINALWTLEGLGELDSEIVLDAMHHPHPQVRIAGLRCAERILKDDFDGELLPKIILLSNDLSHAVKMQAVFSLGESDDDEAIALLQKILIKSSNDRYIQDAALSGIFGNELNILQGFLNDKNIKQNKQIESLIKSLASNLIRQSDLSSTDYLVKFMTTKQNTKWKSNAVFTGASDGVPRGIPNRVMLKHKPRKFLKLLKHKDDRIAKQAKRIEKVLNWPTRPADPLPKGVRPLTKIEIKSFKRGNKLFLANCAGCHQSSGLGMTGIAPPLIESPWVAGKGTPARTIRIVLNGLTGPIKVHGKTWNLEMPNVAMLPDQEIADILTYLRRSWGHFKDPVTEADVAKVRDETKGREKSWTTKELEKIN